MNTKILLGILIAFSMLFMCGMVQDVKDDYASFVKRYRTGDTALTITQLEK